MGYEMLHSYGESYLSAHIAYLEGHFQSFTNNLEFPNKKYLLFSWVVLIETNLVWLVLFFPTSYVISFK